MAVARARVSQSSHGIFLCPAAGSGLILGPVGLIHVGYLGYKWIIGIWISKQGTN